MPDWDKGNNAIIVTLNGRLGAWSDGFAVFGRIDRVERRLDCLVMILVMIYEMVHNDDDHVGIETPSVDDWAGFI